MKDVTTLLLEESSSTVCLIAPLQAQFIQNTKNSMGDSSVVPEIKQVISADLSKRYISEQERNMLFVASALDPLFKGLPFLSEVERVEMYGRVISEAASFISYKSITLGLNNYLNNYNLFLSFCLRTARDDTESGRG